MFCYNCGANIKDDSIFCSKCGTRLNNRDDNHLSQTDSNTRHRITGISLNILNRYTVQFPFEFKLYSKVRAVFERCAFETKKDYLTFCKEHVKSFDDIYEIARPKYYNDLSQNVAVGVRVLIEFSIDYIDEDALLKTLFERYHLEEYLTVFSLPEKIVKEYHRALVEGEEPGLQWAGGGFGLTGAIKGAAMAGIMNIGTEALSGLFKYVTGTTTEDKVEDLKEKLFENEQGCSIHNCVESLFNACHSVFDCVYDILLSEGAIQPVYFDQRKESGKFNNTAKMWKDDAYSDEKAIELFCECIELYPYDINPFAHIYVINPDSKDDLLDIAEMLGIDSNLHYTFTAIDMAREAQLRVKHREAKLELVKKYTSDEKILSKVDYIVCNQEELDASIDNYIEKGGMILCQCDSKEHDYYRLPAKIFESSSNMLIAGIGNVYVYGNGDSRDDLMKKGIEIDENIGIITENTLNNMRKILATFNIELGDHKKNVQSYIRTVNKRKKKLSSYYDISDMNQNLFDVAQKIIFNPKEFELLHDAYKDDGILYLAPPLDSDEPFVYKLPKAEKNILYIGVVPLSSKNHKNHVTVSVADKEYSKFWNVDHVRFENCKIVYGKRFPLCNNHVIELDYEKILEIEILNSCDEIGNEEIRAFEGFWYESKNKKRLTYDVFSEYTLGRIGSLLDWGVKILAENEMLEDGVDRNTIWNYVENHAFITASLQSIRDEMDNTRKISLAKFVNLYLSAHHQVVNYIGKSFRHQNSLDKMLLEEYKEIVRLFENGKCSEDEAVEKLCRCVEIWPNEVSSISYMYRISPQNREAIKNYIDYFGKGAKETFEEIVAKMEQNPEFIPGLKKEDIEINMGAVINNPVPNDENEDEDFCGV